MDRSLQRARQSVLPTGEVPKQSVRWISVTEFDGSALREAAQGLLPPDMVDQV